MGLGRPQVVRQDPARDAELAAAQAAQTANADIAQRKKQRRASSLFATTARGVTQQAASPFANAYGKETLGA
jgi:hypothetical protein